MNRREAIKRTSLLMGYAVSSAAIAGVMSGCKADPVNADTWQPAFFDNDQVKLVAEIADRILPATDTPGAKDVLVHQFMDQILKQNFDADAQKRVFDGLKEIDAASQTKYKKAFIGLTNEEKDAILKPIDKAAYDYDNALEDITNYDRVAEKEGQIIQGEAYLEKNRDHYFHIFKELTFLGYFTSEAVGTEVLNYDPIPGAYQGCIDLPENGAQWSF